MNKHERYIMETIAWLSATGIIYLIVELIKN